MPLLPASLNTDLLSLFQEPPEGFTGCANAWGDAIQTYAAAILPLSTTVTAAVATLKPALAAAFEAGSQDPTGTVLAVQLELAFIPFALTIAAGMLPIYTGIPPVLPMGWATALSSGIPITHADAASKYSDLIDTWMKTGMATRILTPFDTVNWS